MLETVCRLLCSLLSCLPLSKRKILFLSYYGERYNCNPRYLSEYITKYHPEYQVVWAFTEPKKHSVHGVRKVKFNHLRYFYELCTCRVLVTNYRMKPWIKKREGQLYIQTWHSSLRLKMIEKDAVQSAPASYVQMAKADSQQADAILSGCAYSTSIFQRCLWSPCEIIPSGTPRNDLFFHQPTSVREKVLSQLDIPFSTKVLLYAPTFRERKDSTKYLLNVSQLSSFLKELTGEDWVILVRLHPHLHLQHLGEEMNRQVREVTRYEEVQELLAASDMLISDYSSLVFDFALTARPCFLYLPDLDEYVARERKLYFALDQLPFPYSRNEEELKTQIKILNEKDYRSRLTAFMQQTGSYEQGSASANVVAYIKQKIGA